MKSSRRNYLWLSCYECAGRIKRVGNVPPRTYECGSCGNLFRMTKRNKIKCRNAWKKKRREQPSVTDDKYPNYIRPSRAKLRGER